MYSSILNRMPRKHFCQSFLTKKKMSFGSRPFTHSHLQAFRVLRLSGNLEVRGGNDTMTPSLLTFIVHIKSFTCFKCFIVTALALKHISQCGSCTGVIYGLRIFLGMFDSPKRLTREERHLTAFFSPLILGAALLGEQSVSFGENCSCQCDCMVKIHRWHGKEESGQARSPGKEGNVFIIE